jgi:hypothetical protein
MRGILLATIAFLLTSCLGKEPPAQTERFTLDFRNGHNLTILYDAGVRPWKNPNHPHPDLDYLYLVGNPGFDTNDQELNYWTVVLPGGEQFSIATSYVVITVLEDFDIARIDFRGTVKGAQEAADITMNICAAMKISVDESREELITRARNDVAWNAFTRSAGVDFSIALWVGARGGNNVTLQWRDYLPSNPVGAPLKQPIRGVRPPPGYEDVSMERPRRNR